MSVRIGVAAAILSSALGGMAAAATRFVVGATDPITLAALRFGLGFLFLLPLALKLVTRWPRGRDWLPTAGLGVLFFAIFFSLYNWSLSLTTAARGALALSALPLVTLVVAALLGVERLTLRKSLGVLVAMGGVAVALAAGLAAAPPGAWRGDLIMVGATLCMALYTIWSRPAMARSGPLAFLTAGMGCGAACLVLVVVWRGGFAAVPGFGLPQWLAVVYVALGGAAVNFYLWVFALQHTTPTRVASTITVTPITASIVAALLIGEPIGLNLLVGVAAVLAGIWIASTDRRVARPA